MLEASAAMNRAVSQCARAPVFAPSARAPDPHHADARHIQNNKQTHIHTHTRTHQKTHTIRAYSLQMENEPLRIRRG